MSLVKIFADMELFVLYGFRGRKHRFESPATQRKMAASMICARSHVLILLQMSGLSFPASEPYNPRLNIGAHHKRTVESNLSMFVVFQSCLRFPNLVVLVNFLTVPALYIESLALLSTSPRRIQDLPGDTTEEEGWKPIIWQFFGG